MRLYTCDEFFVCNLDDGKKNNKGGVWVTNPRSARQD